MIRRKVKEPSWKWMILFDSTFKFENPSLFLLLQEIYSYFEDCSSFEPNHKASDKY